MRDYHKKPGTPGDILQHHGVKGQKWGVRKEEDLVGRISSPIPPGSGSGDLFTVNEYHRLAEGIAKQANLDSNQLAEKYAPPGVQAQIAAKRQADKERLKKIAIGAGIGLGAAAAGVAIYKINQAGGFDNLPGGGARVDAKKLRALIQTHDKATQSSVNGLNLNWDKGVDLPKGFVLRRLSSVAETVPRPDGFYAAHLEGDVESYKAMLPNYWRQWGVGDAKAGGFLNHYQAKEAIRAPSGKESFEIFKNLINNDDDFNNHFVGLFSPQGIRGLSDERLKQQMAQTAQTWADPTNAYTKRWFKEVKARGYNALIDFNDAGTLSKTPLRVIDGSLFDIVKNEPQSLNDFYTAAKNWSPGMIHVFTLENGELVLIHVDDFLRVTQLGRYYSAAMILDG